MLRLMTAWNERNKMQRKKQSLKPVRPGRHSIQKWNTTMREKSTRLQSKCENSNLCMILGHAVVPELKAFFNGFVSFRYLKQITRIGKGVKADSSFVHLLTYEHRKYTAYAVLKSTAERTEEEIAGGYAPWDNLLYEYLVGTYLNQFLHRFPTFVETYGAFRYKDYATWRKYTGERESGDPKELSNDLRPVDFDLKEACTDSLLLSVLIQNVPNPTTVSRLSDDDLFPNLMAIMYQVYFALTSLPRFTHYDLQPENVLLYEPFPGQYMTFYYHHKDGKETSFKCKYVAKIINYGRCHCKITKPISDGLSLIKECEETDHDVSGFSFFHYKDTDHGTNVSLYNASHDLRFFNSVKNKILQNKRNSYHAFKGKVLSYLEDKKLIYTGTTHSTDGYPELIRTCNDLLQWTQHSIDLSVEVKDPFGNIVDPFDDMKEFGVIDIYSDGTPFKYRQLQRKKPSPDELFGSPIKLPSTQQNPTQVPVEPAHPTQETAVASPLAAANPTQDSVEATPVSKRRVSSPPKVKPQTSKRWLSWLSWFRRHSGPVANTTRSPANAESSNDWFRWLRRTRRRRSDPEIELVDLTKRSPPRSPPRQRANFTRISTQYQF